MEISLDIDCAVLEVPMRLDIADMRRDAEFLPPRAYVERDVYPGPYDVVPTFAQQVLATASRTMAADVAVEPIPVSEVSNPSGGVTMTIGE